MNIERHYLQSYQKHDEVLSLSNLDILKRSEISMPTIGWYIYIERTLSYLLFNQDKVFLSFREDVFFFLRRVSTPS